MSEYLPEVLNFNISFIFIVLILSISIFISYILYRQTNPASTNNIKIFLADNRASIGWSKSFKSIGLVDIGHNL